MKWPERFFKRHGAKTVLSRGSFFCFRPSWSICWPACRKCPGALFLFYNVTGSAAYSTTYTLIGYLFGKQWKLLEAWLGPTALYLMLAGLVIVVLGVIFRHSLSGYWARLFFKKASVETRDEQLILRAVGGGCSLAYDRRQIFGLASLALVDE